MSSVIYLNGDGHRGVSPVVGVILMIAMTVVVSAVVGTFALDVGNSLKENPEGSVAIAQEPDPANPGDSFVTVQIVSAEQLDEIYIIANTNSGNYYLNDGNGDGRLTMAGGYASDPVWSMSEVGSSLVIETQSASSYGGLDSITIIGSYGVKKTVLETYEVS